MRTAHSQPSQIAAGPVQSTLLPSLPRTIAGKVVITVCASIFVALCAHISVHIPFTPVPFTLSDFAVILVGLALGPVLGFSTLLLYLAEGACGLPVFTPGGLGGVAQLLGPTGGYLFAYPLAAALAGLLARTNGAAPRFGRTLLAASAGSLLLMISGCIWLSLFLHLSSAAAFKLGFVPFLPGQAAKVLSATGLYTSLARWRRS